MAKVQRKRKSSRRLLDAPKAELPQKINYMILVAGVAVLLVGYFVMSMGDDISPVSVTIAPIILFIGYCIIIPLGIIYRKKKIDPEQAGT
jgi:phosphoglycerol transferase MdoB-like AlkP superfamily enzyme